MQIMQNQNITGPESMINLIKNCLFGLQSEFTYFNLKYDFH